MKKKERHLIDLASKSGTENNSEIVELLNKYKIPNEFIHALLAIDISRMKKIYEQLKNDFNPNMADFSYCFTWFKPTYRNLPKFILEIGLETESDAIIEFLLSVGCNVNLLNSINGNPLYYLAFEKRFTAFKNIILKSANFLVKNYRGQSILFHLINLHVNKAKGNNSDSNDESQELIDDFKNLIIKNPILVTHRDQDNRTYIEMIITMEPEMYQKALVFLKVTCDLILKIVNDKNFEIIQLMIYQSYGLVLMNSPIFHNLNSSNLSIQNSVTLKQYILDNDMKELIGRSDTFQNNFLYKIYEFNSVIKFGELDSVKKYLNADGNAFLLKSRDYSGRSCLHLAVLSGQTNVVS